MPGAIELFTKSLMVAPTAEGYTFRGWAYSFLGRFDDAIAECRKAIATDPSFGNPYNDIGSYLVHLGRPDEAVESVEKAKRAERFEPRQLPLPQPGAPLFRPRTDRGRDARVRRGAPPQPGRSARERLPGAPSLHGQLSVRASSLLRRMP